MASPRGAPAVGVIPAAGFARRLPGIGGSKEAHPLPPKGQPALAATLEAMAAAGIRDVVLITRPEKRDIPRILGDGAAWGVSLEYVHTGPTRGPADTVDRAYDLVQGSNVAFAFADILMEAESPFSPLLEALRGISDTRGPPAGRLDAGKRSPAAALGIFPPSPHQPADSVLLTPEGYVTAVLPKDAPTPGSWRWGIAAWSPEVTAFIHTRVQRDDPVEGEGELGIGRLLNDALSAGLPMIAHPVSPVPFLDIGTPQGLRWAMEGRRSAPPAPGGGSAGPGEGSD